jgi:hypothetical protein
VRRVAGLRIADVADNHDRHLRYEDLRIIRSIGSGCSSTVKLAQHKVTREFFALKCISLFVKQMRDQLLTELRMLFKSDCEALIDFKVGPDARPCCGIRSLSHSLVPAFDVVGCRRVLFR